MTTDYAALLPTLCDLARQAGDAVLAVYRSDFSSERKSDGSPVTEADTASESVILPALRDMVAGVPVVSEENMADGALPDISAGAFWLVDPLDGTREFLKRNDEFTVNIGLIVDWRPVLGVLLAPALDTLYYGAVGSAAWRIRQRSDSEPIGCRDVPAAGLDVLVSRSHSRNERLDVYLADKQVHSRVPCGSALKFGILASGEADLYPRFGPTSEWDTAAGHAIVRAAGGEIETFDGQPLGYGKPDFLNPGFVAYGRR